MLFSCDLKITEEYPNRVVDIVIIILLCVATCTNADQMLVENVLNSYPGESVVGMSEKEQNQFDIGLRDFSRVWTLDDGLGPKFNSTSCVSCHRIPLPGGTSFDSRSQVLIDDSSDKAIPLQRFVLDSTGQVSESKHSKYKNERRPQPLFGIGYLEAVTDEMLFALEDPFDIDKNGISGRVIVSKGRPGRFGWQSQFTSIDDFVENAFEAEFGIDKNELVKIKASFTGNQNSCNKPSVVCSISGFLRLLAVPGAFDKSMSNQNGRELFFKLGCDQCHTPFLAVNSKKVKANKIWVYSDLLLHEMKNGKLHSNSKLSDSEFRTPPLWALTSVGPPYLHDSSAQSINEAIVKHGGEAKKVQELYLELPDNEKNKLHEFLKLL